MKKLFKIFLITGLLIFTYHSIFAKEDNFIFSAGNVAEKADDVYKGFDVITNYDQWKETIYYCFDNMIEKIVLVIDNYDASVYDMNTLDCFDTYDARSQGRYTGKNRATMEYSFKYKENYKLVKAAENGRFILRLDINQIQIYNKARLILDGIITKNMSDYEKEKAIHDYMVSNYSYAKEVTDESHTIRNLFETGQGVCGAYAYAFEMLCKLAGIDCDTITGTYNGVNHGWNIVELDGEYYHVDVTADDPVPDRKGEIIYDYFNVTDEMISKNHVWDKDTTPQCNSNKYNYFYFNNIVFENEGQMRDFVMSQLLNHNKRILFYAKGFIVKDENDFLFCLNNKDIMSLSVGGNFGNEGVFVIQPVYR